MRTLVVIFQATNLVHLVRAVVRLCLPITLLGEKIFVASNNSRNHSVQLLVTTKVMHLGYLEKCLPICKPSSLYAPVNRWRVFIYKSHCLSWNEDQSEFQLRKTERLRENKANIRNGLQLESSLAITGFSCNDQKLNILCHIILEKQKLSTTENISNWNTSEIFSFQIG